MSPLQNRARILRRAQEDLNVDEGWTYASHHFGITTYYRKEEDGSLSVKLEGEVSGLPLFEQIAVLRDIDLHHKWAPFCTSSMTIAHLDKLDIVGWCMIGMPQVGLARDGCFRVIGCDNMSEDGSVLIAGQGIRDMKPHHPPLVDTYLADDPILDKLNIPPAPTKRGNDRMTLRKFETVIHITSATSAVTCLVANIDPNIPFLSQGIIDFCMKHLCGVLLAKLQGAAKKIVRDPISNPHAERMREEHEFYQVWLLEKFKAIAAEKGWEMPVVAPLAVSEEQLLTNRHYIDRKTRRMSTFGGATISSSEIENDDSFASSPNFGGHSADSVSELSLGTANSVWRNNPVANYVRGSREKEERKKAAKVAHSRQRVADMMRPKQFSFEQRERLEELKEAKRRRRMPGKPKENDETTRPPSLLQRYSTLISKSPATRFLVIFTLVSLLFALLHPSLILGEVLRDIDSSEPSWRTQVMYDIWTAFYILGCGILHFLVCDIALVYAFDFLDIGSKAGGELKQSYKQNVRSMVVLASQCILLFSFVGGIWAVIAPWVSLFTLQLYERVHEDFFQRIPYSSQLIFFVRSFWNILRSFAVLLTGSIQKYLLKSNSLGSLLMNIFSSIFGLVLSTSRSLLVFDSPETDGHKIWRHTAFETAKFFYSHTAVFLVLVLILFNVLVVRPRKSKKDRNNPGDDVTVRSTGDLSRTTSALSGIEEFENGMLPKASSADYSALRSPSENGSSPSLPVHRSDSSSASRRRRLQIFRRRRKGTSTFAEGGAEGSGISTHDSPSQERALCKSMTF